VKVVVDSSVLRRPHTGLARWVNGLAGSLALVPGMEVETLAGPARIGHGLPFRPINLARQRWWYEGGMRRAARRAGADALLMPAGYACRRGLPPQLVVIPDVNFLTSPGTYEWAFSKYAAWTARRAVRDGDGLMTISGFSRSEICRHLGVDEGRVAVVYPGLDSPPAFDGPAPIDRPYALYVGATERHKNLSLLLDVWERFEPDVALAIVGSPGRDHAALTERAAGLSGRVVVTGRVSGEELEAWYRGATVFVFPSLTEGFGYPPLEAMQRGVPVVAARAGSLPEVLGDAAVYHDPADAADVARQVAAVVGDAALRARMMAAGHSRAATFTWPEAATATAALLRGLASHG
jgi:glycosyltransferase involved in cell wall biosynthesis